eukprot:SAG11_NODE_6755_length_1253_cov_2.154246_1_plen_124_part_00
MGKHIYFSDSEDRRYVAAMTTYMDSVVGSVVAALKRTGMWERTFFVWSSDNGAAIELDTGAKNSYPLKGGYYTNCTFLYPNGVLPCDLLLADCLLRSDHSAARHILAAARNAMQGRAESARRR